MGDHDCCKKVQFCSRGCTDKMKFFHSTLLLPFALCSISPPNTSTTPDDLVQVYLPISELDTTYLHPIDLKSKNDFPGLLHYGFIINARYRKPRKIIVRNQTLEIPKNARALLLTLPNRQEEDLCSDIQLTLFPYRDLLLPELRNLLLQANHTPQNIQFTPLPEFRNLRIEKYHVPIYLQYADTPVQIPSCCKDKEEEDLSETLSPVATNYSKRELNIAAWKKVRVLFKEAGRRKWPNIAVGRVKVDVKGGNAQFMEPLTQTASRSLDPRYISFLYGKDDEYTFIKIQNKIINLTKRLKEAKNNNNPNIIIELEIICKESDESIIFPNQPYAKLRCATSEEIDNIPKVQGNHCNIYFKFIKQDDSRNIDTQLVNEEESKERSPNPRRRSCIGISPWPKPHAKYSTFPSF